MEEIKKMNELDPEPNDELQVVDVLMWKKILIFRSQGKNILGESVGDVEVL